MVASKWGTGASGPKHSILMRFIPSALTMIEDDMYDSDRNSFAVAGMAFLDDGDL